MSRLGDAAERLIRENGRSISILSTTNVVGDPAKPWGSATDTFTTSTVSTIGVFLDEMASDLEARLSAVSRLVLSPVETNQSVVYIAAKGLGVEPSTADKIVDGDRTLEIKRVQKVQPGDEVFLYILTVEN